MTQQAHHLVASTLVLSAVVSALNVSPRVTSRMAASPRSTIVWFRKGLRVHDNLALLDACEAAAHATPVYLLDRRFADPARVGPIRYRFLLESLADLDASLRARGSRLFVLRCARAPEDELAALCARWGVGAVLRGGQRAVRGRATRASPPRSTGCRGARAPAKYRP